MDEFDEFGRDWEDEDDIYSGTATNDREFWDDTPVIHTYSWEQAVADGVLVPCFANRWPTLSGGIPILATAGVVTALSDAALAEIWNEFVRWRRDIAPTLPEEERLFATIMNGQVIWVLEDSVFTILFPSER